MCIGRHIVFQGQNVTHPHASNDPEDALVDADGIDRITGFHPGSPEAWLRGMRPTEEQRERRPFLLGLLEAATPLATPVLCVRICHQRQILASNECSLSIPKFAQSEAVEAVIVHSYRLPNIRD